VFLKYPEDRVCGTWVRDADELAKIIDLANASRADAYVMLNPSKTKNRMRPTSADIACIQAVLLDLDPSAGCSMPVISRRSSSRC